MAADLYKKVDIARIQLETAIRLFFIGDDYFSSITLAGASEEIYGRILHLLGKESALYARSRSTRIIYSALLGETIDEDAYRKGANFARNTLKHFDSLANQTVEIDARGSALEMISRAIHNYRALNLPTSELIERFENYYEKCEEDC